jgi:hypothetical protein
MRRIFYILSQMALRPRMGAYKRKGLVSARGARVTQTLFSARRKSFGFFLLLDLKDFASFVIPAVRADTMRNVQIVTVRTFRKILRFEREMTAAAVAASFGKFTFWKRRHVYSLHSSMQCAQGALLTNE